MTSPLDVLHAGPDEGAASGHQERLAVAAAWQQGTLQDIDNISATFSSIVDVM